MSSMREDLAAIIEMRLTYENFRDMDDNDMAAMLLAELSQRGWRVVSRIDLNHILAKARHSSECPKYYNATDEYACTCHMARLKAALRA